MSRRAAKQKRLSTHRPSRHPTGTRKALERRYQQASRFALDGRNAQARKLYEWLRENVSDPQLLARVKNDLAALNAAEGDVAAAIKGFQCALVIDPNCEPAWLNLALLETDAAVERGALSAQCAEQKTEGAGRETKDRGAKTEDERPKTEVSAVQDRRIEHRPQPSTLNPERLPRCLLLMVTYNRLEYTRLALDAVLELDYPNLHIVVWDNGSTDKTVEYLKRRLARVRDVRLELSPNNMGVVHPMNAVWAAKDGAELLVKVDNDTLVPPELVRQLAECHVSSKHFGVLSGFHFRKDGEAIANEKNIVAVNGARVLRQRYVGGCAVMIRRDVFQRFGAIPASGQSSVASGQSNGSGPFLESGWTQYQQRLDEAGLINGYPWPPVHVDHMEDTRSAHCVRSQEHEQYKQAMRGMSLEEFTKELCVWRPH